MLKIGETLRGTRIANEVELEHVERAIRVRAKYLAALEAERIDRLPGVAYGRSFLREYAQYLGLDPQPFLEEYDRRYADPEPPQLTLVPLVPLGRRSRRGKAALLLVVVAAAGGLLAWKYGSGGHTAKVEAGQIPVAKAAATPVVQKKTARPHRRVAPRPAAQPSKPQLQRIVLVSRGRCWLSVHVGSPSGPLVYQGFLEGGRSLQFARQPLWIRFGAPWNVSVEVNGKPVKLRPSSSPINLLFAQGAARSA